MYPEQRGKEGAGKRADLGLEMGLQKQAVDPRRETSYQRARGQAEWTGGELRPAGGVCSQQEFDGGNQTSIRGGNEKTSKAHRQKS